MSEIRISEAGIVQCPIVNQAIGMGWAPIPPKLAEQARGEEEAA